MPTHLTRVVFRQILSNRPILHRGCLQRARRSATPTRYNAPFAVETLSGHQHRFFWNSFGRKPQREIKLPNVLPGFAKLTEVSLALRRGARYPPAEELSKAFAAFVRSKCAEKSALVDTQWIPLKYAFDYLEALSAKRKDTRPWLSDEDITLAQECLILAPTTSRHALFDFARTLYEVQKRRLVVKRARGELALVPASEEFAKNIYRIVHVACRTQRLAEARKFLKELNGTVEFPMNEGQAVLDVQKKYLSTCCSIITHVAARGTSEAELQTDISTMKALRVSFDNALCLRVAQFYARNRNFQEARIWWSKVNSDCRFRNTMQEFLLDCADAKEDKFGNDVIRDLLERDEPTIDAWGAAFYWAVASGKGVEEVERMFNVMKGWKYADGKIRKPNITAINALVKVATRHRNNPYLAERLVSLGRQWNIKPNATTFILQMEYRLSVNDLDGAFSAYGNLRTQETQGYEHGPVVSKLIQEMLHSKKYPNDVVLNVADDLADTRTPFEAATVAALVQHHIERDEVYDAIDLIQTHAYSISLEDRNLVRDVLLNFILDRHNSVARAWDAYVILYQLFDESPREVRTRVMAEFFRRNRPDMACHIFNHMRHHSRADTRADGSTYVEALKGAALTRDEDTLELVHNQMKLDSDVEPGTRQLNALMLANTACGNARAALASWHEIRRSDEGPSHASIALAFQACAALSSGFFSVGGAANGEHEARRIWKRLRELDVEIDEDVFTGYVGVLAAVAAGGGGGDGGEQSLGEVKALLKNAEEEFGVPVNEKM